MRNRSSRICGVPEPLRIAIMGGARSLHTKRWASRLVEHGHAVQVYTLFPDPIPGVDVFDVFGHGLPGGIGVRWLWRRMRLQSLLNEFDPDIVQGLFLWPYGEWARASGDRPVVQSAWGSDVYVLPQRSPRRHRQISRVLAEADAVTAHTASLAESVVALGAAPDRVHPIGWGVDTDRFTGHDDGTLARELGLEGRQIVISSRGHKPIYNLDVIVEAMPEVLSRVPDAAFLFMGHGPMTDQLKTQMGDLGVLEHARFRRFTEPELPRAYAAGTLSVSVPSSDGGPASLLEAMASRLPVVLSDVTGIRELVDQGEGAEIVPVRDPGATANAIVRLLNDPQLRSSHGERNRSVVMERANAAVETQKCLALYRRLCGESG
jgi:glycosyltransferase involved in cell wall biosynthesis